MLQQSLPIKRLIPADYLPRTSRVTTGCQEPGCSGIPRDGKPYCVEHISRMAQVKKILEHIAKKEIEYEIINSSKCTDLGLDSVLIREAAGLLVVSGFTERKLAEAMMVDHKIANALVLRLGELGLAKIKKTRRGLLRALPLWYNEQKRCK